MKSRKLQTNKKNTAKKSTAATKAPAWSGERDYLPICDCSVLPLPWGLVNFCTNRTPLRTIEARSFDMEPLCFNLLSAYKLKSNITTSKSVNTSCIQERTQSKASCHARPSVRTLAGEQEAVKFSISPHNTGNDSPTNKHDILKHLKGDMQRFLTNLTKK